MSLIDDVSNGIVVAMKAKDADVLGTLRMLKTALTMREVEKGRGLESAEELQVVASLVKQRRDSIEQFTKGNRPELAAKEAREIAILERFQPPAATADRARKVRAAALQARQERAQADAQERQTREGEREAQPARQSARGRRSALNIPSGS